MSVSICKTALLTAVIALAVAAGSVKASTAGATSAQSACPVVPFPFIAGVIGPLQKKAAQWMPYGNKPHAGIWICGGWAKHAYVSVLTWCRTPLSAGTFNALAQEMAKGKGKDVVYKKIYGLGDKAVLVTFKNTSVLGRTSGLLIKKGKTFFEVIGGVGKVQGEDLSAMRPMAQKPLIKLGRRAVAYNCL